MDNDEPCENYSIIYHEQVDFSHKCPICLENMETTENMTTQCGHTFHLCCIDGWLTTNITCPLCRDVLSTQRRQDMIITSSGEVNVDEVNVDDVDVDGVDVDDVSGEGGTEVNVQVGGEVGREVGGENDLFFDDIRNFDYFFRCGYCNMCGFERDRRTRFLYILINVIFLILITIVNYIVIIQYSSIQEFFNYWVNILLVISSIYMYVSCVFTMLCLICWCRFSNGRFESIETL